MAGMPSHGSSDGDSGEPRVYFEQQESALCAVHALNNLVQSPLFTPVDLSSAAAELQERERQLHAAGGVDSAEYLSFLAADSAYVSDEGDFSYECMCQCLSAIDISLTPLTHTPPQPSHDAFGIIANLESHWLTLRRIAVPPHLRSLLPAHTNQSHVWLNLNSLLPRPSTVSDTFLSLFLAQLKADGYAMFECTTAKAEVIEGALATGDMAQCDSTRWHSLRSVLVSAHTTVSSGSTQQSRHTRVAVDADEDEKAMQAAIKASMEDVSDRSVIDSMAVDDDDAELRAAIALSMSTNRQDNNHR